MTFLALSNFGSYKIKREQQISTDKSLEEVIGNKLHFLKEARRELVKPTNCVSWKREKEEEMGKETKEELVIER
ncbi:uncharacterized protein MONOS_5506 [Monocercomonoides exilis]|uniref:uncharacterized protein n=1 Tax=Monocercomonoides exilis TaxID=2049356 RepID=UPI00355A4269|nr:hypothetical protein MONOS_5506 [Monocercomonoides exilis]|eukprot:MONOS_5506.1-p1 / transcript=MONOS_5506.1 / gene=MONOS_5506 / organism=Monocercomonoides_exilis_PA203 / gene_product=unspecified product / transcript_product=unspecified product / location=Mono_scaffold00161:71584-71956(-) / protein_length=74 / sequence_SO=supercontig / SO=protein_coding / is_pseudo=false